MKYILFFILIFNFSFFTQAKELLDKVAIIVNQDVILDSKINSMLLEIKQRARSAGQNLPSDADLKAQIKERLIDNSLQLQIAKNIGLSISSSQVTSAIDNLAKNKNQTTDEFLNEFEKQEIDYQQVYNQVEEEILIGEIKAMSVRRRVVVSNQETDRLLEQMLFQKQATLSFNIGHILLKQEEDQSKEDLEKQAQKLVEDLKNGEDFKKLAITHSKGPKALDGGDWGFLNINEMPSIFSQVIASAKENEIIGPISSTNGLHIMTVFKIEGIERDLVVEYLPYHILLTPNVVLEKEQILEQLMDIKTKSKKDLDYFHKQAKEISMDKTSGSRGGNLDWSTTNKFVPKFAATLEKLNVGQFSEIIETQFGYHLIYLKDKRQKQIASSLSKEQAHRIIFNRKYQEQETMWINELRSQAYIEYLD